MMTLREERAAYYARNGFGEDGGYSKWVDWLMLGPVPIPIPNPKARADAIAAHDASHLLAGYGTDWRGEFLESAYELGSGCGRLWFAWVINLHGMLMGALLLPRATLRAWRRGREALSVYDHDMEALLAEPVVELRRRLRVPDAPARPLRAWDVAVLSLQLTVAAVMAAAQLGLVAALLWAVARWLGA
ncbi:MAG TPA: hypothetical protein PKA64_09805 [Myxococcota bacterium]|nr:hypothetical protein [Myxococcota bacterium]